MKAHQTIPACLLLSALLTACGGSSGDSTGEMTLRVTDAPVDAADAVVVEFTGVELRRDGSEPTVINFDSPQQIDLLALTGGDSATLLNAAELPAGRYNQLRLLINAGQQATDSYIMIGDARHALHVPSGELKLVSGFTVPAGGSADFTVDFDLRKAVTNPVGQQGVYYLRPALRLVDSVQVGSISGTVGNQLVTDGCTPAVYVYSGAGVAPDDVGSSTEPLSSATVSMGDDGSYRYKAAFLLPGEYTVAYTCHAAADEPEQDDDIIFDAPTAVTVSAKQDTQVDFQ